MTPFSPPCIKAWRVEPAISDVGGFAIGSDIAVQEYAGSPSTPWFLLLLQVKPGWSTPRGNFSIFNKDIDHHSRSFGSVFDAYGRMVNSNATPGSHVPRGAIIDPGRCRTSWNSARRLECMPVIFQDIPRLMDACGCREISLPCFSSESKSERQSRSSAARTSWLASARPFRYCPPVHMWWVSVDGS